MQSINLQERDRYINWATSDPKRLKRAKEAQKRVDEEYLKKALEPAVLDEKNAYNVIQKTIKFLKHKL